MASEIAYSEIPIRMESLRRRAGEIANLLPAANLEMRISLMIAYELGSELKHTETFIDAIPADDPMRSGANHR